MIPFILKGILRDRSRSVFPILVNAANVFLGFLGLCFIEGGMENLFDATAYFDTGHVKIVSRRYADDIGAKPIELALVTPPGVVDKIARQFPGFRFSRRAVFGGLLDLPDEKGETRAQGPVVAFGMEILKGDPEILKKLKLREALVEGRMIEAAGEILLARNMANMLGVGLGDKATLFTSSVDGAQTAANYKVAGLVNFGINQLDRGSLILDIGDADHLLDMSEYTAEILGFQPEGYNRIACRETAKRFNASIEGEDPFRPVMLSLEDLNNMGPLLDMNDKVAYLMNGIFLTLMVLVLWNAGLLNGLRRYSEIGVRLAIGERRGHIVGSMLIEAFAAGLIGSLLGALLALPLILYFQAYGIDFSAEMKNLSILASSTMKTRLTFFAFYASILPGLFASVLGMFIACLGIYDRDLSTLFKELET